MTPHRTVLVDVGNSAVKLAAHPAAAAPPRVAFAGRAAAEPLSMLRIDLRASEWEPRVVTEAQSLWSTAPRHRGADAADRSSHAPRASLASMRWVVASVNGRGAGALRRWLEASRPEDQWVEVTQADIPLRCELRNRGAVGIDRLLGAMAAWRDAGGSDAIAIDAGSAVTVDLVQQGVFRGGAILPGLRMQLSSLARGTDLLPDLAGDPLTPLEIPGRDTAAAIRSGVTLGIAGAIDRLIERYSELCADLPQVFLTGGDALSVEPLLSHSVHRCDSLVLAGLSAVATALGYDE